MATVYLGIGSNLNDRRKNIDQALALLQEKGGEVLRCSTIIETDPVGGPPQNKFLNGVVQIQTELSPQKLLKVLKEIEITLKRTRTEINGPRTIDLDILLYDNLHINTNELTIPHPRMFDRDFVMKPLREIAPEITRSETHANH